MSDLERRMAWPGAKDAILQASWVELNEWPDALTPDQIGALHARNEDGTSNRAARDELADFLQIEIDQGRIDTVTVTQISAEFGITSFWDEKKPPLQISVQAIPVRDCARALSGFGVGKYLAAWLEPYWLELAESVSKPSGAELAATAPIKQAPKHTEARGTKPPRKMDIFLSLLEEIEGAWMKSGRGTIDRRQWPGTSKDLCVLAGQLMPKAFGKSKPDSFYENYARKAGLCFDRADGMAAVYAELFPADSANHRKTA